ncbi:MAG: DNA repair exonuclease [Sandaracinaceae bacterium]|nr:DNA repair exonuclease [Sandaracinaceae bacterium]MDW8246189.1 DNA repair exonuclease [Sandaracinaceae bacterium]
MPRWLHTSDWQLGRTYASFDKDLAVILEKARWDAVERIVELASERKVDAVLVAGDVFEHSDPPYEVMAKLFKIIGDSSIKWVLLPGNHDPALPFGAWQQASKREMVPSNVVLALTPTPIELGDGMVVLPAPLTQKRIQEDVTVWMRDAVTARDCVRIGLAHGSIREVLPQGAEINNPISVDCAQLAKLDYLALGDWHRLIQVNERTWYSGTPEPDRFGLGDRAGFVLEVEVLGPGELPRVQPHRVSRHEWLSFTFELHTESDLQALKELAGRAKRNQVLELCLRGAADFGLKRELEGVLSDLRASVTGLQVDDKQLRFSTGRADFQSLLQDGYLAGVVRYLQASPSAVSERALRLLFERLARLEAKEGGLNAP